MLVERQEYYKDLQKILNLDVEMLDKFLVDEEYLNNFLKELNFSENDAFYVKKIIEKYQLLFNNNVLNHNKYKLSDYDMEIIRQVPPGGNWRNLSEETVRKSRRITNLTKTGGRTTYYARLEWDKPSYTITTYFNRPGSGAHIHPSNDRVLSAREAARLQSFPDNFYFCGNQREILMQIGNAVPPLFAYQLAKSIKKKIDCQKSLDIFSGAGGMNIGFHQAGIKSSLSIDINKSACDTLKINYPSKTTMVGDLTDEDTIKQVIMNSKLNGVDIITGGPPCQGFSQAGKRDKNDARNRLFLNYIEIVKGIKPKVIVFENVEGLLSYNKGETYKEIVSGFENIGYDIYGKLMKMNEFGVPQKRKRIILIGVKKSLNINPIDLFPQPLFTTNQITIGDAIHDLKDCDFNESAFYEIQSISPYINYLQGKIDFEELIKSYIQ